MADQSFAHEDMIKPSRVEIDAPIVRLLDQYRMNCPTINRSSLVNQILLEWAQKNATVDQRGYLRFPRLHEC